MTSPRPIPALDDAKTRVADTVMRELEYRLADRIRL